MPDPPEHIESTVRLLKRAYPVEIPHDEFFPLVRLLRDAGPGSRVIAEALSGHLGGDYLDYIFEVGFLLQRATPDDRALERVRHKLAEHGYYVWIEGLFGS